MTRNGISSDLPPHVSKGEQVRNVMLIRLRIMLELRVPVVSCGILP